MIMNYCSNIFQNKLIIDKLRTAIINTDMITNYCSNIIQNKLMID